MLLAIKSVISPIFKGKSLPRTHFYKIQVFLIIRSNLKAGLFIIFIITIKTSSSFNIKNKKKSEAFLFN